MADAVRLEGATFHYTAKSDAGVGPLDLSVGSGEVVVLCGTSGSGKTTVTRLVNGLAPHFYEGTVGGTVQVAGLDPTTAALDRTSEFVGSVFQDPRTQFFTTDVTSELAFGPENLGVEPAAIRERIAKAAADLDLSALFGRGTTALSGGETQRVACASIHTMDPAVYVLDEPSSALDQAATGELANAIGVWKAQGKAVLVAEHRLDYLAPLADRFCLMVRGQIAHDWTREEFLALDPQVIAGFGLRSPHFDVLCGTLPGRPERILGPVWAPGQARGDEADRGDEAGRGDDCAPSVGSARGDTGAPTVDAGHGTASANWAVARGITVRRGKNLVLDVPELTFPEHAITAVMGPNGAGKTTLARWLTGLIRPGKGTLAIGGRTLKRRGRLDAGYLVAQNVNQQLFAETCSHELELGQRHPDPERARRILEALDLADVADDHPMSLSGGQKQRLAIGAALASGRELIVLDEPTSGLDLIHMTQVADALCTLRDAGTTVVIVTHDRDLVATTCDYVLRLDQAHLA
jgi:energy-coupling factor transport system ATP-binding protein